MRILPENYFEDYMTRPGLEAALRPMCFETFSLSSPSDRLWLAIGRVQGIIAIISIVYLNAMALPLWMRPHTIGEALTYMAIGTAFGLVAFSMINNLLAIAISRIFAEIVAPMPELVQRALGWLVMNALYVLIGFACSHEQLGHLDFAYGRILAEVFRKFDKVFNYLGRAARRNAAANRRRARLPKQVRRNRSIPKE